MKVWESIDNVTAERPSVTIGIFDGVHHGHRHLLNRLKEDARTHKGESMVVTLWPHPRKVLNKEPENLRFLTTLEEKIILLQEYEIDHLVIIPFTREFSRLGSCEFVKRYLVDKFGIHSLLVGFDHKFGKGREGDYSKLQECAELYGFRISRVNPLELDAVQVSSSLIRESIENGDISKANVFLGYPFFITGEVIQGNRIGREIGFPTANVKVEDENKIIPPTGVYGVETEYQGQVHRGMLNIGFRPTLEKDSRVRTIEVHLFDFEGDLYGKRVNVRFYFRMRDEKRFGSVAELKAQLEIDKAETVRIFAESFKKESI